MHGLTLTIDKEIQYRAQRSLEAAVAERSAKGGHCLVLDPRTGAILAMAVTPGFNPNAFIHYRPHQWRNRAVTDCFEPGSALKAFLLAAGLEEAVVSPLTLFDCEQGEYRLGGHTINDTHEYELLNVADIVIRSSNIGAIKIGQKLGYPTYVDYLKKFGFGSKTGIDLLGERTGFIRAPEKAKPIDRATVFFGQGMTVTSIQLAAAMGAIANGGKLMRPFVVKAVEDKSGKVVRETGPKVVRRVVSRQTAETVTGILEKVAGQDGTAPQAAIAGYRVAGKTGTAQKVDPETRAYSREKYTAVFVGFVPAERPRMVISVVIDEPRGAVYGGVVAAPVFSEVGEWALHYLRIDPNIRTAQQGDRTTEHSRGESAQDNPTLLQAKLQAGVIPDFRGMGMREVLRLGRSLGLKVLLRGSGLAVKQQPQAGKPLEGGGAVEVCFRPPA
jgi:cell division protein FtsI (penicillin-binding protein 3)